MAIGLKHINTFLAIVAAFLLIIWLSTYTGAFFGVINYELDSSEPRCKYVADDYTSEINDMDLCCFQIQQLLTCEIIGDSEFDYVCYNVKEGNQYYITSKTFNYCLKIGYDVKAE